MAHTRHSPFDEQTGGGFTDAGTGLQLPPWERRQRYGFLNALYLTIKDVLLAPGRFFRQMPSAIGLREPLLFAIVVGAVATFLAWLWAMTGSTLQVFLHNDLGHVLRGPFYAFATFVFSPLLVAVSTFIQAGIIHLLLMLLDGNRLGFEATFRVCAYAVAADLLVAIPFCGNGVAFIWSAVILIIGITNIHQTEPWKAVVAVVLPLLLCVGVLGGGMLMLVSS